MHFLKIFLFLIKLSLTLSDGLLLCSYFRLLDLNLKLLDLIVGFIEFFLELINLFIQLFDLDFMSFVKLIKLFAFGLDLALKFFIL